MRQLTSRIRQTARFSARGLMAVAFLVAAAAGHRALGQDGAVSRWSAENPPTPAALEKQLAPVDNGLRRLPPVEETSTPQKPTTAAESAVAKNASTEMQRDAKPVDWTHPRVVIGPEVATRRVSHEEPLPASSGHEGASANKAPGIANRPSRFTQNDEKANLPSSSSTAVAVAKPRKPVFARVFDETAGPVSVPEEAEAKGENTLSPIFACRLLGLPATTETPAKR